MYSTARGLETQIEGGLGSDTLIVAPQDTMVSVPANDLRGYSSVVQLTIDHANTYDTNYLNVAIEGITVK